MRDLVLIALVALTSFRITRLVVEDRVPFGALVFRIQSWAEDRWETKSGRTPAEWGSNLAYALSCSWCAGVWVSGATTLAACLLVGLPAPWLVWGASAAIVGLLARGGE